jgi:Ribosomal L18 C-terminal region
MDKLKKEDEGRFKKQFSKWSANLTSAKAANVEALYKRVHTEIRKSPLRPKVDRKNAVVRKQISKENGSLVQQDSKGRKWLRQFKLTKAQRTARVAAKIQRALAKK